MLNKPLSNGMALIVSSMWAFATGHWIAGAAGVCVLVIANL